MLSSITRVEGKTDSCKVSSDLHTQAGAPECVGMGKRPKLNKQGGNTHHLAPSKPASPLGAPRGGFSKFSGFIFCPQSQLPKTEYKTPGLRLCVTPTSGSQLPTYLPPSTPGPPERLFLFPGAPHGAAGRQVWREPVRQVMVGGGQQGKAED